MCGAACPDPATDDGYAMPAGPTRGRTTHVRCGQAPAGAAYPIPRFGDSLRPAAAEGERPAGTEKDRSGRREAAMGQGMRGTAGGRFGARR